MDTKKLIGTWPYNKYSIALKLACVKLSLSHGNYIDEDYLNDIANDFMIHFLQNAEDILKQFEKNKIAKSVI